MARSFVCPTCSRPIEWTEAFPFRPFCSERCRLIDLGAWLSGERAIPGEPAEDSGLGPSGLGPTQGRDSGGGEDR